MDNRYSCEVIQDLIPGYIDQVLSETGIKVVQEHLEDCSECQKVYQEMKEGEKRVTKIIILSLVRICSGIIMG